MVGIVAVDILICGCVKDISGCVSPRLFGHRWASQVCPSSKSSEGAGKGACQADVTAVVASVTTATVEIVQLARRWTDASVTSGLSSAPLEQGSPRPDLKDGNGTQLLTYKYFLLPISCSS